MHRQTVWYQEARGNCAHLRVNAHGLRIMAENIVHFCARFRKIIDYQNV